MKHLRLLILVAIGLLTACSGGGLHLEKDEDLNQILKNATDAFGEENIKEVSIYSDDALNDKFGSVSITYKRGEKYYEIDYNGQLSDPRKAPLSTYRETVYKNAPSKKVSDFTMDGVAELYKKSVEQLNKEQNDTLENFVLAEVTKSIKKDGSFETSLKINCTKKGEATTKQRTGRRVRITTNYYSVYVEVQKDGSLKLKY